MKTADIKNLARQIDTFTLAYIEAALWSSTDDDGRPFDADYSWQDLAGETLAKMVADCSRFQAENDLDGYPSSNAGHDFWLTRNHHGCGFWENDYGTEDQCAKLTKAAHAFGQCDLYIGDDGKIYS